MVEASPVPPCILTHSLITTGILFSPDRKKDLVKLQAGEYVSLSKVETAVKVSPLVDQICVCADSLYNYTVALVVPNQKNLTKLAQELGINGVEFNQLCQNTSLVKEVLKRLSVLSAKCLYHLSLYRLLHDV